MATYACEQGCEMEVNVTCAKCGEELSHVTLEKEDGTTVGVAQCSKGCGKIKSPLCLSLIHI